MRTMLRRRIVLPVLLTAVAAIAGGLFAGLGGPDPVGDTSAHSGHSIYYHFLPPLQSKNSTTVRLTCGWHALCASTFPEYKDGVDDVTQYGYAHGVDFSTTHHQPLYLRGYAYAPGHTDASEDYRPVTVTIDEWMGPSGDPAGTRCHVVEAVFTLNDTQSVRGKYRLVHAEFSDTAGLGPYYPKFSEDGGNSDRGFEMGRARDGDTCAWSASHAHVER